VEGVVEGEFVGPLISGETLLRYRILPHQHAVLPCTAQGLIGGGDDIEIYRSLAQWWRQAEEIWTRHRSKERLSLKEQLDYQSKLTKQLPIPTLRVVYIASGMHLCAAKLEDRRAIVAKSPYWAAAATQEEADYLCALLNAPATTEFARPYMSYGKDERHFDKHIWQLPNAKFDPSNPMHNKLARLCKTLHSLAAKFFVDVGGVRHGQLRHPAEVIEPQPECCR
jgi:hypothetical protein